MGVVAVSYQNLVLALGDIYAGIIDLKIDETLNEHGSIALVAVIDNKQRKKVLHESKEAFSLVYVLEQDIVPLFSGIITFQEIETEGKLSYLTIYAKTVTYFMDFSPFSKSFQNIKMTSHELIKEVMKSFGKSQTILHIPNERIGELVLQYEETSWEFLKRFVSRYHAQIRVESDDGGLKLEIGSRRKGASPTGVINIKEDKKPVKMAPKKEIKNMAASVTDTAVPTRMTSVEMGEAERNELVGGPTMRISKANTTKKDMPKGSKTDVNVGAVTGPINAAVEMNPRKIPLSNWDKLPYEIYQNMEAYNYLKENQLSNNDHYQNLYYVIETFDIVPLGFRRKFHGKTVYVCGLKRAMREGILINYYTLCQENGLSVPKYYNNKITGTSIFGNVIASKRNRVQVHLNVDGTKKPKNPYWFPYSTVAASSDGSGWYCMPKEDEQVRIFFPENKENDGYAITTLAAKSSSSSGTSGGMNPSIKNISTPHGKEIVFTETGIVISADGGKSSITLSNDGTVSIGCQDKLVIGAGEEITISAGENITITAENKIAMSSGGGGSITMEPGEIAIAGIEIHQN